MTELLSLDCSTLPLMRTLYCWLLSKEITSTIFKVFGMTRPGIETRSPEPLANTSLYSRVYSSSPCIDALTQFLVLVNPLPLFSIDSYTVSMLSLRHKAVCIVSNFFLVWSIFLSFSLVDFKNCLENLTMRSAQVFLLLMRFLLHSFVSESFLVFFSNVFCHIRFFDGVRF